MILRDKLNPCGSAYFHRDSERRKEFEISDLITPEDRPSYWGRYEAMDFDRLSEAIVDALEKPSDPESEAEPPRSKEEFLSLWEMLREKYDAQVTPPEPDKLETKRARLRKLFARVEELEDTPYKKYKKKGREIRDLDGKIDRLIEEIEELEERGDTSSGYVPWTVQGDPRYRTLWEVRGAISSAFESIEDLPTTRFGWRFAETADAEGRFPGLGEALQRQSRLVGFDQERLDNALALGPKHRYEWIEGYDGYSVFEFPHTPKKLMESFMRNNALFVIEPELGDDWKEMNKQELRTHPSVTRILHRGKWRKRIKEALEIR